MGEQGSNLDFGEFNSSLPNLSGNTSPPLFMASIMITSTSEEDLTTNSGKPDFQKQG